MPAISGVALEHSMRVDRRIKWGLPTNMRDDALMFRELSIRLSNDAWLLVIVSFFGIFFPIMLYGYLNVYDCILVFILMMDIIILLIKNWRRSRKALGLLIKSNPKYWADIRERIEIIENEVQG